MPTSKASPFVAPAPPGPDATRRRGLKLAAAAACVGAAGVVRAGGSSAPEWVLRFSHVVHEDTPKGQAALRFKALVEARTGGRIQVKVSPQGRLYGDHDEMQALQLGAVELVAPSLSKFGRIGFPEFEMFDLPYLFAHVEQVRRLTRSALGERLLARLGRQQLVGLGFMDNGFKHMSANRPLLEPGDYVGLRMRVQSSWVLAAQMRALGARPVTLAFGETRRALAAGVVDGTENPVSNFWTQGMHEVQSDLSLTHHGYLGYAVVAHQRFWGGLRRADRELLEQALAEALAFGNQVADVQNERFLASVRASGFTRVHALDADQLAQMKRAVQPVHQALMPRIGPQWFKDMRRLQEDQG